MGCPGDYIGCVPVWEGGGAGDRTQHSAGSPDGLDYCNRRSGRTDHWWWRSPWAVLLARLTALGQRAGWTAGCGRPLTAHHPPPRGVPYADPHPHLAGQTQRSVPRLVLLVRLRCSRRRPLARRARPARPGNPALAATGPRRRRHPAATARAVPATLRLGRRMSVLPRTRPSMRTPDTVGRSPARTDRSLALTSTVERTDNCRSANTYLHMILTVRTCLAKAPLTVPADWTRRTAEFQPCRRIGVGRPWV
jgi:hypothetical protein